VLHRYDELAVQFYSQHKKGSKKMAEYRQAVALATVPEFLAKLERRKAFKREDRKRMILLAFAVEETNGRHEMTLAQIAKYLRVTPSTKLRSMVVELEIEGLLKSRTEPYPGVAKKVTIWELRNRNAARAATRMVKITNHRKTAQIPMFSEE
jgi:hypothetical protein